MTRNVTNNFGNSSLCVKSGVKGVDLGVVCGPEVNRGLEVESAETGVALEVETNGIMPNLPGLSLSQQIPCGDKTRGIAPALEVGRAEGRQEAWGPPNDDWGSHLDSPLMGNVNSSGPCILRTRTGDLMINGPVYSNPFLEKPEGGVENDMCHQLLPTSAPEVIPHLEFNSPHPLEVAPKRKRGRPKGAKFKKTNNSRTLPLLPPNKLLRLPAQMQQHASWLKKRKHNHKDDRCSAQQGSDPIQNSNGPNPGEEETAESVPNLPVVEIGLEVVLPVCGRDTNCSTNSTNATLLRPEQQVGTSGLNVLCNIDHSSVVSRAEVEAATIMGIQEDLGLKFHGVGREDLERAMEMEVRDKKEKDEWEQNTSYQ
jgi:uncharacterized protein YwlG (UPF0340 family)